MLDIELVTTAPPRGRVLHLHPPSRDKKQGLFSVYSKQNSQTRVAGHASLAWTWLGWVGGTGGSRVAAGQSYTDAARQRQPRGDLAQWQLTGSLAIAEPAPPPSAAARHHLSFPIPVCFSTPPSPTAPPPLPHDQRLPLPHLATTCRRRAREPTRQPAAATSGLACCPLLPARARKPS